MKKNLKLSELATYSGDPSDLPSGKLHIATINAYSYVLAQRDALFAEALLTSDILLPDGVSIVFGKCILNGKKIKKIAGEDFFYFEMKRLNKINGKCFFLGSSREVLEIITITAARDFPNVTVATYSPPYADHFSAEDNEKMIRIVNEAEPDVLFVGMTAPKQEKWVHEHFNFLHVQHLVCIGAVFDFYAGTVKRAPIILRYLGLEWLYRLVKEPKRMWRRYLIGNRQFIGFIIQEYLEQKKK